MACDGRVNLAGRSGSLLLLIGLLMPALAAGTQAPGSMAAARAESRLEGRLVPDIPLRLSDGRELMLSELGRGQDLLLTFFYRRCAGVCTPFLHWVAEATAEVGGLGTDYRILALSFDEADGVEQIAAQARALGLQDHPSWQFAVTGQDALADITGALEFWYRRQPDSSQYDHGSLLAAVSDGRVVRALTGGPGETQRLRELIWELRGRIMPYYPVSSGPVLRCLSFDSSDGSLKLDWGMLLLVLPALASLGVVLVLFRPGTAAHRA